MVAVRCGIHVLWVVWKDQQWLGFDGSEKKIIVPVEDVCVLVMNLGCSPVATKNSAFTQQSSLSSD